MLRIPRLTAAAASILLLASVCRQCRAQSRGDIGSGDGGGEDDLQQQVHAHDSGWGSVRTQEKEEYHLTVFCKVDTAQADVIAPDNGEDMEVQFWNSIGQNRSKQIDWNVEEDGSGSGGDIVLDSCGGEMGLTCNHPREAKHTLTALIPSQQYTFCLKNISSQHSIICKNCKMDDSVPLENPLLEAVEAGFDFVEVRWQQLDEELIGGPDLTYKLVLEDINAKNQTQKTEKGTSTIFSKLSPGSNFTVSLTAENSVGESQAEKHKILMRTHSLEAPHMDAVNQEWHNYTLTSTISWRLDPSMMELCATNCTTLIQLWHKDDQDFLQVGQDIVTDQWERSFELPDGFGPVEELTRDTHLTLKTLYGSLSSPATQHTRIFGPMSVPLVHPNVTQSMVGHTFIEMHWKGLARVHQGGPGIQYRITLTKENETISQDTTKNTSYSLTDLAPGTTYSVGVSSVNNLGLCSSALNTLSLSTKPLLPPSSVAVSHEWTNDTVVATVTWRNNLTDTTVELLAPPYELIHEYNLQNQTEIKLNLSANINEETLLRLKTSLGQYESEDTKVVALFPGISAPLQNPNISLLDLGLTSISLEWSALPSQMQGAPGVKYTVRCKGLQYEFQEVFSSNTSLTLNDLIPGREYNISVTAENIIGQSGSSVSSQLVKTKELLPPGQVMVSKEWVNQSLVAVIQWKNQQQQEDQLSGLTRAKRELKDEPEAGTMIQLWNIESGQKTPLDSEILPPDQTEKRFTFTLELANVSFSLIRFYRGHKTETDIYKLFDGVSVPLVQPKITVSDVGNTFIRIEWPQLTDEQKGAPGLQFKVICNASEKQYKALTSSNNHRISDMIPGEEYSISVISKNMLGESHEAATIEMVQTDPLLPPIDIMVDQEEEDTTLVSWRISHNVSLECSQAGVYLDLWNQLQSEYILVESHSIRANQLNMELRLGEDLDYGTMLSMKSYCGHFNSTRSQRLSLFAAPDLAPPVNISVNHIWKNDILTANIDWQFPESGSLENFLDKGGVILELWTRNGSHYSPVTNYTASYNQTQISFNMSGELSQRTMFRMLTYYQDHQSPATNMTELFYDVSQKANTALLERLGLIAGMSILCFAVLTVLVCHLVTKKRKKSYNTSSAVGYDNCNNTQLKSFSPAKQCQAPTPVKETSDGGYGSLRGSVASSRLRGSLASSVSLEGDDMWFLYSGMDEDGSFIGDASFAINNGNEAIAMWRQMDENKEWREADAGELPLL